MKPYVALGLLLCCFLCGCLILPPYDEVDYGKRPDGSVYIRDTKRSRAFLKREADEAIAAEKAGKKPMGGLPSWEEKWKRGFTDLRNGGVENPEHCITYIVEARRAAGLPELLFRKENEPNQRPERNAGATSSSTSTSSSGMAHP